MTIIHIFNKIGGIIAYNLLPKRFYFEKLSSKNMFFWYYIVKKVNNGNKSHVFGYFARISEYTKLLTTH